MALRALYELYDRVTSDPEYSVAPTGFSYQKISFVVVLERDGRLSAIQDARTHEGPKPRPRRLLVPGGAKKTGSGLNPCFLWDNAAYLLGYDPGKPDRALLTFDAFRKRHLDMEAQLCLDEYSAVCRFLESWNPADAIHHDVLTNLGSGFGVFQILGEPRYLHDYSRIKEWWEANLEGDSDVPQGQCVVTGQSAPLARLHPPIKGVAGAQTTGAAIVSFNLASFESYGKCQSFNAPVSVSAAEHYTTALNALLDGPQRDKHRLVVGNCTVAFWTDRPSETEDIFLQFISHGSLSVAEVATQDELLLEKLGVFMRALRSGQEAYGDLDESPDATGYCILGLSPNAARLVVRFFHQGSISELLDSLRRHFSDMSVERQWGDDAKRPDPEFPPVRVLATAANGTRF